MKLNLSGWYNGRIGLEKKVVDLSGFEIGPRITEQDLENYYNEFLDKSIRSEDYFYDNKAFSDTREEIKEKKPKLIARESVYPGLFSFKDLKSLESIFSGKIEDSKYFYAAHCIIQMRLEKDSPFHKLIDIETKKEIKIPERYKEFENYPAIIEVPNDRTNAETKGTTFHENLHYFIYSYQEKSKRLLTKDSNHSKVERAIAEKFIQENIVEYLTDLLLEDDKDALFEQRWLKYKLEKPQINLPFILGTALPTGWLIGSSIGDPKLISLIPIPAIISQIIYNKYKASKKEELTKTIKREKFKI